MTPVPINDPRPDELGNALSAEATMGAASRIETSFDRRVHGPALVVVRSSITSRIVRRVRRLMLGGGEIRDSSNSVSGGGRFNTRWPLGLAPALSNHISHGAGRHPPSDRARLRRRGGPSDGSPGPDRAGGEGPSRPVLVMPPARLASRSERRERMRRYRPRAFCP